MVQSVKDLQKIREELTPVEFFKKMKIEFLTDEEIDFDIVFNYPGVGFINRLIVPVNDSLKYEVFIAPMTPLFEELANAEEQLFKFHIELNS